MKKLFPMLTSLIFLTACALPGKQPESEYQPWFQAIAVGDLTYIQQHADKIETRSVFGTTSLMIASSNGQIEVMQFLLAKSTDINAIDLNGDKAIDYAVAKNQRKAVDLLLKHNCRTESNRKDGITALMISIQMGFHDISKALIEKSLDLNLQNEDGWSALHYAVSKNSLPITELLLSAKANVDLKNTEGESPLFFAIEDENLEMVKLLLKYKANTHIKRNDQMTPLDLARSSKKAELVKLLHPK